MIVAEESPRDRSGSQEDLTLSGVAVANHQGACLLIPLFSGCLDVVGHLGFESFGEHPPGSGSGDLVEIEQESFVLAPKLMYPLHRCTPSRRRANVGSPLDCSKGRYTTLKRKSRIHNFWLYLPWQRPAHHRRDQRSDGRTARHPYGNRARGREPLHDAMARVHAGMGSQGLRSAFLGALRAGSLIGVGGKQPVFGRPASDLGPRAKSQLAEDSADVIACRALGDPEVGGDLAVG